MTKPLTGYVQKEDLIRLDKLKSKIMPINLRNKSAKSKVKPKNIQNEKVKLNESSVSVK